MLNNKGNNSISGKIIYREKEYIRTLSALTLKKIKIKKIKIKINGF